MSMTHRSAKQELMDLGPAYYTQEEYDDCLIKLAKIGKFLGGNNATLQALRNVKHPESILDVGCGGGQFAIELSKLYPQSKITGIDISQEAIHFANQQLQKVSAPHVNFEQGNSSSLPFTGNNFDVVTSTLVCHHFTDDQLIDFLKNSYRIAKKSVIINDLHRNWLAYGGFALLAKLFFRNRLIFHDGLLSIQRSFKKSDWIKYLTTAGIPLERCSIQWCWAFRWVVTIDASSEKQ